MDSSLLAPPSVLKLRPPSLEAPLYEECHSPPVQRRATLVPRTPPRPETRKRFARRVIKLGLEQDGFVQILEGLNAGELVANEGALYLSTAASGSVNSAD